MRIEKYALPCGSVLIFLGIWQIVADVIGSDLILAPPLTVIAKLCDLCGTTLFWQSIVATLVRVLHAFCLSVLFSLLLGIVSGISARFSLFIAPFMTVLTSVPMVSVILLAMFWFGSSHVPVFAAVVMTVPVMEAAVASGIRSTDRSLVEMCSVYRIEGLRRLRLLYIPSLFPSFASSASTALGMTWKVVAAGEVLSLPRFGAGSCLQASKMYLDTSGVLAWTVAVLLLSSITTGFFSVIATWLKKQEYR